MSLHAYSVKERKISGDTALSIKLTDHSDLIITDIAKGSMKSYAATIALWKYHGEIVDKLELHKATTIKGLREFIEDYYNNS